jgi:predicted RNA binding protein YcfA (HicA-like mRNA interferase family)
MTPKAKRLTAKEIIRILLKHNFEEVSQTGSTIKFFNIKTRKTVQTFSLRKGITSRYIKGNRKTIGILFNYEDAGTST